MIMIDFHYKSAFRRRQTRIGAEKRPEHGSDRPLNMRYSLITTTQTILLTTYIHIYHLTSWGFGVLGLSVSYGQHVAMTYMDRRYSLRCMLLWDSTPPFWVILAKFGIFGLFWAYLDHFGPSDFQSDTRKGE